MNEVSNFLSTYWSISIFAELAVPIVLLAWRLPRKPHAGARGVVLFVGIAALAIVPLATGVITGLTEPQAFVYFSVLLGVAVGAILFMCDVSTWTALFCATAGYTLQNLSSGLSILVNTVATGRVGGSLPDAASIAVSIVISVAVYLAGYWLFVQRVDRAGLFAVENKMMAVMFAVVVCIIIGFDIVVKGTAFDHISWIRMVLLRLIHASICIFVLFSEYSMLYSTRMRDEKDEAEQLLAEREKQYRMSRENIDAINIKCHDIRHQIHLLSRDGKTIDSQVLDDIAREVNVYDSSVETGNEALDTILTEKGMLCQREGITLACIADGAALDFVSPTDLYALFGNIVENAIEAVRQVDDPERRIITLSVQRNGAMVTVNVENYYAVEPVFKDGLPQTTKSDTNRHGFGMRSVQTIVRRYDGVLHTGAQDGVFYVNALLPVPA